MENENQGSDEHIKIEKRTARPRPAGGLSNSSDVARGMVLDRVPERLKGLFLRVLDGEASPRQAIKAKCYECVCFEDVNKRIRDCTVYTCPIWGYRPFK
jgi:hypothetical protein